MTPSSNNPLLSMVRTRRTVSPRQKRKAGRKKFQETRHPVYKGVRKRNGKWVCELRQPHTKRRIWLGTFPCPKMAARAHDVAAWALKGESSSLNFPEAAHSLPGAKSGSIEDIQVAALELSADDHNKKIKCTCTITTDTSCDQGSRRRLFVDEDEVFNMPALIDSMAEGLILTPPALKRGFSWSDYMENEASMDLTLWTD